MARQTPAQKDTIERVMHEFKHGKLEKRDGTPVDDPKQAIAIALHETGNSEQEDSTTNKRNLVRTKRKETAGQTARDGKERTKPGSGETRALRRR